MYLQPDDLQVPCPASGLHPVTTGTAYGRPVVVVVCHTHTYFTYLPILFPRPFLNRYYMV